MMNYEQLTKLQTFEYFTQIINECKECLEAPCMSDYRKEQAKLNAFDNILKEFEWCETQIENHKGE